MSGDGTEPFGPPPAPPIEESSAEAPRPSCAIHLANSIEEKDPDKSAEELEQANTHSREARIEQCKICLGRPAVNIVCPLPGPQHPEGQIGDLSYRSLEEILNDLEGTKRRLVKLLRRSEQPSANPFFDMTIRRTLHLNGIPQVGSIRAPHPSAAEEVEKPPPQSHNRETRPPRVSLVYEGVLEERPPCAGRLVTALGQRAFTIERWGIDNLPLDEKFRKPIDHSASEKTYAKGIQEAQLAPKEQCEKCFHRDLCPLVAGVSLKKLYDTTNRTSVLPSGLEFKVKEVILEIGKGRPRDSLPQDIMNETDDKLSKKVKEVRVA